METFLSPYKSSFPFHIKHAHVLAPHPDDEVFGCGGTIALMVERGISVYVTILSSGEKAGDAAIRESESRCAQQYLGYQQIEFLRIPDRNIVYADRLVNDLVSLWNEHKIDLVFCPSPWEIHPDHRQTCAVAIEAARKKGGNLSLCFYEVGSPLIPNQLINITSTWDKKNAAMHSFATQIERQDYAQQVAGLNRYRSYTLGREVKMAEAFCILNARNISEFLLNRFLVSTTSVNSISLQDEAYSKEDHPLVSVMIRSIGRDELYQALDSVALQTYPNLEIVVIAAIIDHPPLPSNWFGVPILLIPSRENIGRSRAANRALQYANGEFRLFLDDDDWLFPEHITRLVENLRMLPKHGAAYAGVLLVDENGIPKGQSFDIPYDSTRLLSGNLFPIHSVLFRASLLEQGLCFDPKIDLYEDWDFWLRLSKLTSMIHLPGVSAAYRVHSSSGIHERASNVQIQSLEISKKWASNLDFSTSKAQEKLWRFSELEDKLVQNEKLITDLNYLVNNLTRNLNATKIEYDSILNSYSWKLTSPLRLAKSIILNHTPARSTAHIFGKIIQIIRREGIPGIYHRLYARKKKWPWNPRDYRKWRTSTLEQHFAPTSYLEHFPFRPLFSILMPVYNPPIKLLREAINSVQRQNYTNWELCIVDDASPNPDIWQFLTEASKTDSKIKIKRRATNGHISQASNDALQLASGQYIVLMDNDDLLPANALYEVAKHLQTNRNAMILYSDEDKIDSSGQHFGPYFKPDWNRLLFMGHNLISHLGVFNADLIRQIGGFRVGFEGSQDYDLALRAIELVRDDQIIHIPKVLYHWRAIEGSTALSTTEKPYAVQAAQRALFEHRERLSLGGLIEITSLWNYRCHRPGRRADQRLCVLLVGPYEEKVEKIPTWLENPALSVDEVMHVPPVTSKIIERIKSSTSDIFLLVRSDLTPVDAHSISDMVNLVLEPAYAICAGSVWGKNKTLVAGALVTNSAHGCSVMMYGTPEGHPGYMGRLSLAQEVSAVSLDCIAFDRTKISVEALNVDLPWGWCSSLDIAWQLQAQGLKLAWNPSAKWRTSKIDLYMKRPSEEEILPIKKFWADQWAKRLSYDPCYPTSLDRLAADFSFPPNI